MKKLLNYFSMGEKLLWLCSMVLIIASFAIFDREKYLTLTASVIGVTALIFNAKGNPIGQALIIIFSVLYAVISYSFAYYGEMITYLGMSAPMAVVALVSWLKNPYNGNKAEVKVNRLKGREIVFMAVLTVFVTFIFYFILKYLGTANLAPSTFSVTTSFVAAYLTFRRSPFFAFAYALNDVVLLILWTLAAFSDISYLSVIICFAVFLINDLYGFVNWLKMRKKQQNS